VAEQGHALYPDDLYFGLFYQIGLSHQGRLGEALAATRDYVRQHPEEPNSWDELALRHLSLGQPDSAEAAFREALSRQPDFLPSARGLGFCAYTRGDLTTALALTEPLLERADLMPSVRVQILTDNAFWPGLSHYDTEAGRHRSALARFETARALVDDPVSELRLDAARARLLLQIDRASEVLAWTRSLADHPEARLARLTRLQYEARALAALDSLDAARHAVDRLLAAEPDYGGVVRFDALKVTAEIALAENRPNAALAALADMARHGISDGGLVDLEYREARARAHLLAGDTATAETVLRDLLRVYRSRATAHLALAEILGADGRHDEAARELAAFEKLWADADPGLEASARARRLAGLLAP
jgi:tetratricopeptide (TPR) repeat protein